MKKLCTVIAATAMVFSLSVSAFAAVSPTGDVISKQEETNKSPKTAESSSILFVELAGAALAVTAFYSKKKSKEA